MAINIADEVISARRMIGYWQDKLRYFTNKKEQKLELTKEESDRARSVRAAYARDGFTPAYDDYDILGIEAVINGAASRMILVQLTDGAPDRGPSRQERKQSSGYMRSWRKE